MSPPRVAPVHLSVNQLEQILCILYSDRLGARGLAGPGCGPGAHAARGERSGSRAQPATTGVGELRPHRDPLGPDGWGSRAPCRRSRDSGRPGTTSAVRRPPLGSMRVSRLPWMTSIGRSTLASASEREPSCADRLHLPSDARRAEAAVVGRGRPGPDGVLVEPLRLRSVHAQRGHLVVDVGRPRFGAGVPSGRRGPPVSCRRSPALRSATSPTSPTGGGRRDRWRAAGRSCRPLSSPSRVPCPRPPRRARRRRRRPCQPTSSHAVELRRQPDVPVVEPARPGSPHRRRAGTTPPRS